MVAGKNYPSSVVVRGKSYTARALEDIQKWDTISVIGKTGEALEVARTKLGRYGNPQARGVETRVYHRGGLLSKDGVDVLCDLPKQDIELNHLEFSTNYSDASLYVFPYKADGELDAPIMVMTKDGLGYKSASPANINDNPSIVWKELLYDETNNYYKFGLAYPIRFANGIKIHVYNPHPTEQRNIACETVLVLV